MKWIAYCKNCKEELVKEDNGGMVESYGKKHAKENNHVVIVGYEVDKNDKN
jgi:hypothetical protein